MTNILPQNLEKRLTSRAKNVLIRTYKLAETNSQAKNEAQIHSLHILFALSSEQGSLSKNILESYRLTARTIADRAGFSEAKLRNAEKYDFSKKHPRGICNFSEEAKSLLKKAVGVAAQQNQPYIGTEHILYALVASVSKKSQSKNAKIKTLDAKILPAGKARQIKNHLDKIFSQGMPLSNFPYLPEHLDQRAPLDFFSDAGELPEDKSFPKGKNRRKGLNSKNMHEPPFGDMAHEHSHHHNENGENKKTSEKKRSAKKFQKISALTVFCENLTLAAERNELDPVAGRKKEIARIVNILAKRTKNNPLLIGEPGVGKTAIVQGLAQKITDGDVPEALLGKQVFSLNLGTLVAGTMFRGDFEARIQDIISESSNSKVILFIDEIHTIIGTGSASGSLDAANILKPALSGRKLQCIGATTIEEYKKYIEKERALERRLQPIHIKEESEQEAVKTLLNLKKTYESHHGIIIKNDSIKAAVELSARYIKDRFLPDKALDTLDEAASRLKAASSSGKHTRGLRDLEKAKKSFTSKKELAIMEENYKDALVFKYREETALKEISALKKNFARKKETPVLTRSHIEEAVEEATGIPIHQNTGKLRSLDSLEKILNARIIGQKKAVAEVVNTLKRNMAGLGDKKRPAGSFLFVGPSGVGKTALAKDLAEGQSQNLIKIDMSEYAEPYSISRMLGSPPGYVGHDEGGELTEKIRRNPYSVVLFDEMEKAHPQVHNILLSILDEGSVRDATGRDVSFKNSIIILTSNANSDNYSDSKKTLGFLGGRSKNPEGAKYEEYIKSVFKKEVTNRVDKIIEFGDLEKKHIQKISALFLSQLAQNLAKNGFQLKIAKEVPAFVAQKGCKNGEGARLVRSAVEKFVENPLAEHIIQNRTSKKIAVSVRRGKIYVKPF